MSYNIIEELPFNFDLRNSNGIHLVKDGGLMNNDLLEIETNKVEVEKWTVTEETVHDCIGNGQCNRCSVNDRTYYDFIQLKTNKGVFLFERHTQDKLGSVPTDYQLVQ